LKKAQVDVKDQIQLQGLRLPATPRRFRKPWLHFDSQIILMIGFLSRKSSVPVISKLKVDSF